MTTVNADQANPTPPPEPDPHDDHHGPAHLAHHFDTVEQQASSAKLGMWVFLATEILMFGGLFCAYAVYRGTHPEVFLYSHHYLDTFWGAFNTVVLLISSFTMAWGVRCAQLGQQKLLLIMLAITFCGGIGFMIVKGVEYGAKFKHALGPGDWNAFYYTSDVGFWNEIEKEHAIHYWEEKAHAADHTPVDIEGHIVDTHGATPAHDESPEEHPPAAHGEQEDTGATNDHLEVAAVGTAVLPTDYSVIKRAHNGPGGLSTIMVDDGGEPGAFIAASAESHAVVPYDDLSPRQQALVAQFFQIYFAMTGLHGLHVLIGMGLIAWVFFRSLGGAFGPEYNTPVDIVGLYWHLVDLIWIFLFPLLYLIH